MSLEIEAFLSQRGRQPVTDWTVQAAMAHGMNSIGAEHGLPALRWNAINEDGGVLEGFPVDGCPDAEALCLAWASALGFTEFTYDLGNGIRSWYLTRSSWHIEISTEGGAAWLRELDE